MKEIGSHYVKTIIKNIENNQAYLSGISWHIVKSRRPKINVAGFDISSEIWSSMISSQLLKLQMKYFINILSADRYK